MYYDFLPCPVYPPAPAPAPSAPKKARSVYYDFLPCPVYPPDPAPSPASKKDDVSTAAVSNPEPVQESSVNEKDCFFYLSDSDSDCDFDSDSDSDSVDSNPFPNLVAETCFNSFPHTVYPDADADDKCFYYLSGSDSDSDSECGFDSDWDDGVEASPVPDPVDDSVSSIVEAQEERTYGLEFFHDAVLGCVRRRSIRIKGKRPVKYTF